MTSRHPVFDYLLRLFHVLRIVARQLSRLALRRRRHEPLGGPELLREGFEQVGGCFVKFGQILSLQIDTLPREYCDALLTLLDRVPTCSREEVDGVFMSEFGSPP